MAKARRPVKVLIAKLGLDGHDRGAKVLTMGLRDEGMEVIYLGIRQTPENIVKAAIKDIELKPALITGFFSQI